MRPSVMPTSRRLTLALEPTRCALLAAAESLVDSIHRSDEQLRGLVQEHLGVTVPA